jgi:hypothetical protein
MLKRIWDIEYQLKIYQDEWSNPREYGNIWILITQHNRYDLSDEEFISHWNSFEEDFAHHINYKYNIIDEFESSYEMNYKELETIYDFINKNIIYERVYMMDHSWIAINTNWFWCGWDSWQIGYIYSHKENITKELILKEWEDWEKKLRNILINEVEYFNKYLIWDFYYFNLSSRNIKMIDWVEYKSEFEEIDSCWWLDSPADLLDHLSDCPFTKEEIEECEINY